MSILCWNYQSLGGYEDLTIPRLRELRKEHFPDILFIMETMNGRDFLEDLHIWLGYDRLCTVNPRGRSGGLALLWKSIVDIDFFFVDKNLLDLRVKFGNTSFFVSCVYGKPVMKDKHVVWERLTRIGCLRKESWCMLGDFNDLLHNGEKLGGPLRGDNCFVVFNDMIRDCQMSELQSSGNSFTWRGMRHKLWIQCKLGRCFGNNEWFKMFPASNQHFLAKRGSDHRPVLVRVLASAATYRGNFKFDKRFLDKPNVKSAILESWNQGSTVSDKIRSCRQALSVWKE